MAVLVQVRERVSFQKDIYSSLIRGLIKQRNFGELCDVTLRVNGRFFFAHKAVLAASSPYFRSMFTSRMKEENSQDVDLTRSLFLDCEDSFKQLLDFMYTGDLEITTENAEDILRIADFLLLEDVKSFCREFYLIHGNLNVSNSLCISALAEHHNMPGLAVVAKGMVMSRFHDYHVLSEEILEMPEQYLFQLLSNVQITQFTSSDNLVKALLRWVKYDERDRATLLSRLLSCVNFDSLSSEQVKVLLKQSAMQLTSSQIEHLHKLDSFHHLKGDKCLVAKDLKQHSADSTGDAVVPRVATESALFAITCNPAMKHVRLILYRLQEKCWYNIPLNFDAIIRALPPRLGMCSCVLDDGVMYVFLSYNLPYPTDMLRIHVLELNLWSRQHSLLTFYHRHRTAECCQTTLTDDRSVPPCMVYSNGYLCIVGNMEGTGQIYLCDIASQTYMCYQIPGTRFISLSRAVSRGNQLYIWCRHRFGHEEYCINKEVSFAVFNLVDKTFEVDEFPSPPSIGYGDFSDMHVLCVDDSNNIAIHTPGKASLVLDEAHREWVSSGKKTASLSTARLPAELPYQGYQVYTSHQQALYIFQNQTAFTTTLTCLDTARDTAVCHVPPPMDGISLVTAGELPTSYFQSLPAVQYFDDTYTRLSHNRVSILDCSETEETGTPHSGFSDVEEDHEYDGYEYDDDIYGYYDGYGY